MVHVSSYFSLSVSPFYIYVGVLIYLIHACVCLYRLCTRRRSDVCKVGSSLQNKFKINVPTRSVPTSSYGSLLVSPPGKITTGGDFYPYYYLTPKANDIWSAPEMPTTTPLTVYDSDTQWNSFDQVKSPPQTRNCLKDDGGVLQGGQTPPLHNNSSSSSSYGDRTDTTHVMTPSYHPTQVHRLPLPPEPSPSLLIHTKAVEPTPIQKNGTWKKGKLLGRGTFGSVYAATNRYIYIYIWILKSVDSFTVHIIGVLLFCSWVCLQTGKQVLSVP